MATRRELWTRLAAVSVTTALLAAGLGTASPASAGLDPAAAPAAVGAGGTVRVGSLDLRPCGIVKGALCGRLAQPWDSSGGVRGKVSVGFAFLPASDHSQPALGTYVPHEGGPGYSTTGSGSSYAAMYGPLLARHNMLLVDQRGTGLTAPINCPSLEFLTGAYAPAAAICARKLGSHADLYGSASSADDLAGVISALGLGPVDLYGDSYGTFFVQVFAGRHSDQLRSVVLDSAYPTTGETAWYPTQTAAMTTSFVKVCARTPACAALGGPSTPELLAQVLDQVRRKPYEGTGYDAEGVRHHVVVDGKALVSVAFGATYGPGWYRELGGALRSALRGNRAALIRLVAEADYPTYGSDPVAYSEGLDAATSCHDYPQLYDMTAPPAQRKVEYAAAVRAEKRTNPDLFAPFTIDEYLNSFWEEQDWCLSWPVARRPTRQDLPRRRRGATPTYPSWCCPASSTRSRHPPRVTSWSGSSRTRSTSPSPTASTSRPTVTRTAAGCRSFGRSSPTRSEG